MKIIKCRGCGFGNLETLVNLGHSPISNEFLPRDFDFSLEKTFPLHAIVCLSCALVQLTDNLDRETLFKSDYVYYSSYSKSWLEHCESFAEKMINELDLDSEDLVVEIASNDGYLLQYFKAEGIGVLGIEPTAETARYAEDIHGIPTIVEFFGVELANELSIKNGRKADLLIGNNVLAHVPDLHDFIAGVQVILSENGIATFEFPHITNLISQTQFDTIYHEHYSYLGIVSLSPLFEKFDLEITKVEQLETHGGSLRIFVQHKKLNNSVDKSVQSCIELENSLDPRIQKVRLEFQSRVDYIRTTLVDELNKAKQNGLTVIAYGAAAKGNTLLNYCGITENEVELIIDNNPHKQGLSAPGSHISVVSLGDLRIAPDLILILPWNLKREIVSSFENTILNNSKAFVAVPQVEYVR